MVTGSSFVWTTTSAASFKDKPLYSMRQDISCAATWRMNCSPVPVQETAQVLLFAYVPKCFHYWQLVKKTKMRQKGELGGVGRGNRIQ